MTAVAGEPRRLSAPPLAEPRHEPVPRLVEALAQAAPAAPAVLHSDRVWSYGELWARSATLAQAVLASGVARGDAVAVTGPKSPATVASLLGILAAGAVAVPVDPALPRGRKEVMLREARAVLCLSAHGPGRDRDEAGRLGVPVLDADLEPPPPRPLPLVDPGDPAYVFFTSGTTGVPRAVLGRHAGLSHFLDWQRRTFRVGPSDGVAQLTSLSFDVVLRDVFLPLTSGARLHLPPSPVLDGPELLEWLAEDRVTLLHAVPTLARRWLDRPDPPALPHLRAAFFAGEPLSDVLVRRWRGRLGFAGEVVNLYGPTETTLAKCWFRVPAEPAAGVQPIGRPLPQTEVLVLDERGRPCPTGEPGELAIRTPFRTLGYLNDPAEQRRRFVLDPRTGDPGDLVFRTGDRGRLRPDGLLEILGRLDHQVKIHGVRVEPREAELVLERHPGVRQAAVVPRPGPDGEIGLVGYVVLDGRPDETLAELRRALREALPAPAVPSALVRLDALPATPNGKLDRSALPDPQPAAPAGVGDARSLAERRVAEAWEAVLGRRVGPADDFFELGGDSLGAARVAAILEQSLDRDVRVRDVLERPTVAELALLLEGR